MTISPIHCPHTSCRWSAHGIPDEYVEARDWHLAAHRADVHGVQPTPEQVAYATRAGHVIADHVPALLAEVQHLRQQQSLDDAEYEKATAEIERLKAERDAFRDQRNAVFKTNAELLERVEYWQQARDNYANENRKLLQEKRDLRARVAELEAAQHPATGNDDPNDNRRRLYIDGKGNGWISVCSDEGTEWVVPVQPEAAVEQDVRDVADETGSLREIGRCW